MKGLWTRPRSPGITVIAVHPKDDIGVTTLDSLMAQLVADHDAWSVTRALKRAVLQRSRFLKEQGHAADPDNTTGWNETRLALAYLAHLLGEAVTSSVIEKERKSNGKA